MNIINVLMIIFIFLFFWNFLKTSVDKIKYCKNEVEMIGMLIGVILYIALMGYAVFFYSWN